MTPSAIATTSSCAASLISSVQNYPEGVQCHPSDHTIQRLLREVLLFYSPSNDAIFSRYQNIVTFLKNKRFYLRIVWIKWFCKSFSTNIQTDIIIRATKSSSRQRCFENSTSHRLPKLIAARSKVELDANISDGAPKDVLQYNDLIVSIPLKLRSKSPVVCVTLKENIS